VEIARRERLSGSSWRVLDLMMPHVGGLTVCRRLRARGDRTPILIVTARTEVSDRVAGLDASCWPWPARAGTAARRPRAVPPARRAQPDLVAELNRADVPPVLADTSGIPAA
jgi:two-component system response regulator MprA